MSHFALVLLCTALHRQPPACAFTPVRLAAVRHQIVVVAPIDPIRK